MSTASWMHFAEGRGAGVGVGVGVGVGTGAGAGAVVGAVTGTGAKFEDAMAEFRANGRDSDDGRCVKVEVPTSASSPLVPMSPCSMCGICPSLDAVASKEIGAVSSPSTSPDVESSDLQQQFGAGLKKLLVDKPNLRADSAWPFLRRDFPQMSSAAPGGLESIWQLGAGQYPRPNLAAPLGGINFQLQRLQQLRQKKTGFVECVFCRNNGEQASFYRSHELKDQLGRVICPVLRAFTCPCCGATGDNAHTIKYCPERGTEFIPGLAQLKVLRMANSKRRINIPRRFTGSQELGPWFNQE